MKYKSVLDLIGNTPLVQVPNLFPDPGVRLWVKLEGQNPTGSVKDRIALAMVEAGEATGELTKEKIIMEPTSGNTGIALAMVAKIRGYRFNAVMPDNASAERVSLLRAFGAEITFSEGDKGTNGSVAMAQEMAKDDRYYMPFQYGNQANLEAHYKGTAQEIIDDLPEVKAFVAGLGTGGTLMGNGKRLKEHDPDKLDGKIKVRARESIVWTKELLQREGIFAGISAGAVIWVAQRVGERLAESGGGDIVCLLADGGWKYLSTEAWTQDLETAESQVEETLWW